MRDVHTLGPSEPVRVVFLLEDLEYGGTQRQAVELARRVDPGRFRVELWVLRAGDDLASLARDGGIPVVWLSRSRRVGPVSLLNLARRLHRDPPQVLMLLTVIPNIWGRLFGRWARVPVIVGNCRGGAAPQRQHERWLWPLADHILCNSALIRDHLVFRCRVPARRLSVVANGVDTDFFRPAGEGLPPEPPVVLSVARLVPDKDHETLIAAFSRLHQAFPQARLWLVGNGPRRQAVEQLVSLNGLASRVNFLPTCPDLRPYYHRAAVLALSSVAEALPNVVLEAMACGLPVVATRVGGLPEAVVPEETGLLVPPRAPEALAAALGRILADPELRSRMGRRGRQRALADFSWPLMVARHEELWSSLLRKSPVLQKPGSLC